MLPGQDWEKEISKAIKNSDAIIICLSKDSITKEGYVQKEIKSALDKADLIPDGRIFLIPVKLDDYDSLPDLPKKLQEVQHVNLLKEDGFVKLLKSLEIRSQGVGDIIPITSLTGGSMAEKAKQLAKSIREKKWEKTRKENRNTLPKPVNEDIEPVPQKAKEQNNEKTPVWGIGIFFTALVTLLVLGTFWFTSFTSTQVPLTSATSVSITSNTSTLTTTVTSSSTETPVVSTPTYTPTLFQELPIQNLQTPLPPIISRSRKSHMSVARNNISQIE